MTPPHISCQEPPWPISGLVATPCLHGQVLLIPPLDRGLSIDYRIVPGSFPNPVVTIGVCCTAVDAAAGGLTTGWWTVVLECFHSYPLPPGRAQ